MSVPAPSAPPCGAAAKAAFPCDTSERPFWMESTARRSTSSALAPGYPALGTRAGLGRGPPCFSRSAGWRASLWSPDGPCGRTGTPLSAVFPADTTPGQAGAPRSPSPLCPGLRLSHPPPRRSLQDSPLFPPVHPHKALSTPRASLPCLLPGAAQLRDRSWGRCPGEAGPALQACSPTPFSFLHPGSSPFYQLAVPSSQPVITIIHVIRVIRTL